jgi:carboxymethylenebutenolidase
MWLRTLDATLLERQLLSYRYLTQVPDIFGYKPPNPRLIADGFAKEFGLCVVPDLFLGTEPPVSMMETINKVKGKQPATFIEKLTGTSYLVYKMLGFLFRNSFSVGISRVKDIMAALTETKGIKKFMLVGYCWGYLFSHLAAV